jgi:hypothetical protein
MPKWEFMEVKITHDQIEVVDDEFRADQNPKQHDPYEYVKRMIDDGWELVTRSGSLSGEFSVVLKRALPE